MALSRFKESTAQFRKSLELTHKLPVILGFLGLSLGLSGRAAEACAALERLHELAAQRWVLPTRFAWTHFGLGNVDETFL